MVTSTSEILYNKKTWILYIKNVKLIFLIDIHLIQFSKEIKDKKIKDIIIIVIK